MTVHEQKPLEQERSATRRQPHRIRMFGRSLPLPASQVLRISLGVMLLAGGALWFLPVLGIWMLPLGLAVLSVDVPIVRRWSRRATVALHRRYPHTMDRFLGRRGNNGSDTRSGPQ